LQCASMTCLTIGSDRRKGLDLDQNGNDPELLSLTTLLRFSGLTRATETEVCSNA
jgi:hypothetical protein